MKSSTALKFNDRPKLERDLLQYGILVAVAYQLFMVFMSMVPVFLAEMVMFNLFVTMMLIFLYLLAQRVGAHPAVLLAVHGLALGGFTFFWVSFGGLAGTVPSFLCIYTAFIIVCSSGYWRWFFMASLSGVICLYLVFSSFLGMKSVWEPEKINSVQQGIDYLIMSALLIAFILYMKRKFVFYRHQVSEKYRQLDQISKTLHQQNQELATRQEETRAINENLEALVAERTMEAETKNQDLAEYAFINAHMLRGPLCRMIGLIHLMEKEPDKYSPEQLIKLKSLARKIDLHVREISTTIG